MRRAASRRRALRPVWTSTFHRFCARLLREYAPLVGLTENFTIYDTSDSHNGALKRTIEQLDFDPGHYTLQQIAAAGLCGQIQDVKPIFNVNGKHGVIDLSSQFSVLSSRQSSRR